MTDLHDEGGFRKGPKMIYLARANPSVPVGAFPARWRQHGRFCHGIPVWNHLCHYEQCLALGIDLGERVAASVPGLSSDWDGVGLIWFWSAEALSRAELEPSMKLLVADELETFDQVVAATALVTRERVHRDRGATNIKLISFVKRNGKTSSDEFYDFWGEAHARTLLGSPKGELVRKYVQNFALPDNEGPMAAFDGVAELGFESVEDLKEFFLDDTHQGLLRSAEERFIEIRETVSVLTDETLLLTDPLGQDRPVLGAPSPLSEKKSTRTEGDG